MLERHPRWAVLVPVLLALVLRVAFLVVNWESPYFAAPLVDAKEFHDKAVLVVEGTGMPERPYDRPPLFYYLVALVYGATGVVMRNVLVVHALLGVATVALTAWLGWRLLGPKAGLAAGVLLAVARLPLVLEGQLLNETLQTALLIGAVAASVRAGGARALPWMALAGVLGGLAILTRPTSAFLVGPLFLVLALRGRPRPAAGGDPDGRFDGMRVPRTAAVVALVLLGVVTSTSLVRNRLVGGEWVLVSYNGGINFFVGNGGRHHELIDIRPGLRWERLVQSPRALTETGVFRHDPFAAGYRAWDRRYWDAGLADMAADPGAAAARLLRKAAQFFAAVEIDRNVNPSAFVAPGSALGWVTLAFAGLGPLALAGLVLLVVRRPQGWEAILLGVGAAWLTGVLFFVTSRYRMPAYPFLALAAGYFLAEMGRAVAGLRERGRAPDASDTHPASRTHPAPSTMTAPRTLILGGGALAASIGFAVGDPGRAMDVASSRAEYLEGVVHERIGDVAGAIAAYRRAGARWPDDPDVLFSPTSVLLAAGQPAQAARLAGRCTEVFPDHPSPWFNLGLAHSFLGEHDAAVAAFEELLRVKPSETKAYFQLGKARIDAGRPGAALDPLIRATEVAPTLGIVWVERARALLALGRHQEARAALVEAARRDPGVGDYARQYPELGALR